MNALPAHWTKIERELFVVVAGAKRPQTLDEIAQAINRSGTATLRHIHNLRVKLHYDEMIVKVLPDKYAYVRVPTPEAQPKVPAMTLPQVRQW